MRGYEKEDALKAWQKREKESKRPGSQSSKRVNGALCCLKLSTILCGTPSLGKMVENKLWAWKDGNSEIRVNIEQTMPSSKEALEHYPKVGEKKFIIRLVTDTKERAKECANWAGNTLQRLLETNGSGVTIFAGRAKGERFYNIFGGGEIQHARLPQVKTINSALQIERIQSMIESELGASVVFIRIDDKLQQTAACLIDIRIPNKEASGNDSNSFQLKRLLLNISRNLAHLSANTHKPQANNWVSTAILGIQSGQLLLDLSDFKDNELRIVTKIRHFTSINTSWSPISKIFATRLEGSIDKHIASLSRKQKNLDKEFNKHKEAFSLKKSLENSSKTLNVASEENIGIYQNEAQANLPHQAVIGQLVTQTSSPRAESRREDVATAENMMEHYHNEGIMALTEVKASPGSPLNGKNIVREEIGVSSASPKSDILQEYRRKREEIEDLIIEASKKKAKSRYRKNIVDSSDNISNYLD